MCSWGLEIVECWLEIIWKKLCILQHQKEHLVRWLIMPYPHEILRRINMETCLMCKCTLKCFLNVFLFRKLSLMVIFFNHLYIHLLCFQQYSLYNACITVAYYCIVLHCIDFTLWTALYKHLGDLPGSTLQ